MKFLLLIIHTALFMLSITFPGFLCQNNGTTTCKHPFQCGTMTNISYPFWGPNRPLSCGYPSFELYCRTGHAPLLNISSVTYTVLDIDFSTHALRLSRHDLWNTTCPSTSSLPMHNTTLNPNIFKFPPDSNYENITLHSSCNNSISVPVNRTAARALESPTGNSSMKALQDALADGFWVRWSADTTNNVCENCRESDGTCGCNGTVCYMERQGTKQVWGTCLVQSLGMPPAQSPGYPTGGPQSSRISGIGEGVQAVANITTFLTTMIACCYRRSVFARLVVPVVICIGFLINISIMAYYKIEYQLNVTVFGTFVICFIFLCIIIIGCSRGSSCCNKQNDIDVENFLVQHGSLALKQYKYSEIKKMTKSLREKLGQGGYGSVYKGKLPDDSPVAVKVLADTDSNGDDFINEVASISKTSHVNIVNLLGFCFDYKKRALVYEYMPNKSLDKYIGSANTDCRLDLEMLYKIAVGVAKGLEYLHTGCSTRIVHFDIKPQNILLDEEFCPKISDFGLAKLCKKKQSLLSVMGTRGTVGYIAPEVFLRNFGGVSHKSDVYSYGMMILEMAGANTSVGKTHETAQSSESYFPDKIYEQTIDDVIGFTTEAEEETAQKMFLVGFWCIQTNPSERPSISKVVEMLEGSVESIRIPPKPVLSTPTLPVLEHATFSLNVEPPVQGIMQI